MQNQLLNNKQHASKMKKFLLGLTLAFWALANTPLHAQYVCVQKEDGKYYIAGTNTPCPNVIITAVPFLRIVTDARSGAMGDAGIALSADADAVSYNDSKLVFADKELGLSASYTPWLRALGLTDVYLAQLNGYYKIGNMQAVGLQLKYFSLGNIDYTDLNGQDIGQGKPNEFAIKASYARKLSENFSAGIGAKFVYSNLAAGQTVNGQLITIGTAGSVDVSATYQSEVKIGEKESMLRAALAITNIGSKITYVNAANNERDFIPTNLGLGVAWEVQLDDYNKLTLTSDVNKLLVPTPCLGTESECDPNGNGIPEWKEQSPIEGIFSSFGDAPNGFSEELRELSYSIGAEYWYDDQFALRAGFYTENQAKGARNFLTLGLGLKYNVFGLNFSYLVPTTNERNPLDNTIRFSLLFDFSALTDEQ